MSNEAPGELELVRAFVNTYDAEDGSEDLPTAPALKAWLAGRGLIDGADDAPVEEDDAARARELREALRAMLRANHGEPLDPAATETVDAGARRAQLSVRFGPDGVARVEPLAPGVDGAL